MRKKTLQELMKERANQSTDTSAYTEKEMPKSTQQRYIMPQEQSTWNKIQERANQILNNTFSTFSNNKNFTRFNYEKEQRDKIKNGQNVTMDLLPTREGLKQQNQYFGKGNIDLNNRKIAKNEDGSISTVRSMSFYDDKEKKEILVPTVINGKVVSDDEAIDHYYNTGEYLGKFNTIKEANNYAEKLHNEQEKQYSIKNNAILAKADEMNELYKKNIVNRVSNKVSDTLQKTLQTPENLKNGYQFGDLSTTAMSTLLGGTAHAIEGVKSVGDAIANHGAYAVASVADITGNHDFSERLINAIQLNKEDTENITQKINNIFDKSSILGETGNKALESYGQSKVFGILGEKSKALEEAGKVKQSKAMKAFADSLVYTMGANAGFDEAYNQANTTGWEAILKATGGGLSSYISENINDVFGYGGNKVTKNVKEKFENVFKSGMAKAFAKLGFSSISEGAEEIVEDFLNTKVVNNIVNKVIDEKKYNTDINLEDSIENAVIAMVSVWAGGTPTTIQEGRQIQRNQEIINNSNLTDEQKTNLTQFAEEKNLNNEQIQKAIEMTENQATTMQNKAVLNQEQQTIQQEGKQAQNQLSQEFEESAKKYNIDTQNETVKQIKSLADKTNNALEFSDNFDNDKQLARYTDGKIEINAKVKDTNKVLQNIALHEAIHSKSESKEFQKLVNQVLDFSKTKGEYQGARTDLEKLYKEVYKNLSQEEFNRLIDEEVVTNTLGEYFGTEEKLNEILNNIDAKERRSFVETALDIIKDIINKFTGYKDQQQYFKKVQRQLEKVLSSEEVSSGIDKAYITIDNIHDEIKNLENTKISKEEKNTILELTELNIDERRDKNKISYIDTNEVINNIVELGKRDLETIKILIDDIKEHGFIEPVYISKETGKVIDGGHRAVIASEFGIDSIPVEYINSSNDIDSNQTYWRNTLKEKMGRNIGNNSSKYSYQSNGKWQEFVDKYFKGDGTGQIINQVKLPEMSITKYQEVLDNAKYIPQEEKTNLLQEVQNIKRNKSSLDEFKNLVNDMNNVYKEENTLNTKETYSTGRKEKYQKYLNSKTEYDNSALKNAMEIIPANNQGRRTKEQWLNVAKQKGNFEKIRAFRNDKENIVKFTANDKAQGLYVSNLYDKNLNEFTFPFKDEEHNTDYEFNVVPKKPLRLNNNDNVKINRGGELVTGDTGVQALYRLIGESEFKKISNMSFENLLDYAKNSYPQYDWSTSTDKGDILSGLGACLSREKGYDSIIPPKSKYYRDKIFDAIGDIENEMVILNDNIIEQPLPQNQQNMQVPQENIEQQTQQPVEQTVKEEKTVQEISKKRNIKNEEIKNETKFNKLTKEQEQKIKAIKDDLERRKKYISLQADKQMAGKIIKGLSMQASAEIRKIIQGDYLIPVEGGLTNIELKNRIEYLRSNYKGKKVIVNDKQGTIIGNAYGKVGVKFEDGTQKYLDKKFIKPIENIDEIINKQAQKNQTEQQAENQAEQQENIEQQTQQPVEQIVKEEKINLLPNKKVESEQTKQRKHYESIMKSSETSKEAKSIAKKLLGTDTYVPDSNKAQLERADQRIGANPDNELNVLTSKIDNGDRLNATDIAVSERLIEYYSKIGDLEKLETAIQNTALAGTQLGQSVQALSLINRQTPVGQVTYIERTIKKLNQEILNNKGYMQNSEGKILNKKGEDVTDKVELSDFTSEMQNSEGKILNKKGEDVTDKVELFDFTSEMQQKILNSNKDNIDKVLDEVYDELGNQVTKSTHQKIDSWRYFSMLASIRTHLRNIIGNFAMGKTQQVKNLISASAEGVAGMINPEMERTKTLRKSNKITKQFAKNDIKNVASELGLNSNKYTAQNRLKDNMREFKSDALNNTLGKLYSLNNTLLEVEDGWGLKSAYVRAFSNYITANKLDVKNISDTNLRKARKYAINQAQEATFHQASALASAINQFSARTKAGKAVTDANLPFVKTPINVAKTGLEYNPAGLIYNSVKGIHDLNTGKITVNQYIDNVSKGLTGTGISLLGYALAEAGIVKASGGDDDKEKYEQERGSQAYSIKIGDNTYTLDWLAPVGIPFFVGVEAHEIINAKKEEKTSLSTDDDSLYKQGIQSATNLLNALATSMNPTAEMSMISGLTSTLRSFEQGVGNMMGSLLSNAGKSYINQFVPTSLGQVARVTDDKQRSTTSTATGILGKTVDQTKNQIMAKIPGLRQKLPVATDIWGQEKQNDDNITRRAFETFIAPYTRKDLKTSRVDSELNDLYDKTGDDSIYPDKINKELSINGQDYRLTNTEYIKYSKDYGQNSYNIISNLVTSNSYQGLTDEEKEKAIKNAYSYAKEVNKINYANKVNNEFETSTLYNVMSNIPSDSEKSKYLIYLSEMSEDDIKAIDKKRYILNSNMKTSTKEAIYQNSLGKNDKLYQTLYSIDKVNIDAYLDYSVQEISADEDEESNIEGKTISGSRKNNMVDYLNSSNLSLFDKLYIYGKSYKLDSRERQIVNNGIQNSKLTSDEKKEAYKGLSSSNIVKYKDGNIAWK